MKISEPGWNKKEENQRNNRLYGSLFLVLLPSQYLFYLLSFEFCLIKIMYTMVHDIFQGIVEHWQCFSAVWDSWKLTKQKSNIHKISWYKLHKTWKLYNFVEAKKTLDYSVNVYAFTAFVIPIKKNGCLSLKAILLPFSHQIFPLKCNL